MDSVDRAAELNKQQGAPVDVGYVYVLKANGNMHKIGKTHNLKSRIRSLQTASPTRLEVHMVFKCVHCGMEEGALHDHFASHRVNGEWFELGENQLSDLNKWCEGDDIFLARCFQ